PDPLRPQRAARCSHAPGAVPPSRPRHRRRRGPPRRSPAPLSLGPHPSAGHTERMARVTLQTIADRLGVSRMTVSNAFSRPDQLSDALRERILQTARAMGYVGPDPTARALVRGRAGTVGVL